MRNLLQFVVRYNYIFTFLVLEAVAFFFIIRNHSYQRTGFLNSAGVVAGNIYKTYFKFSEYLNLGKVNEDLKEENVALRDTLQRFRTNIRTCVDICDSNGVIRYVYIPVKAINYSTNRTFNYITFDQGSNAGIEKDMGVITADGVIGIINQVSSNFSTARSVLNKDCPIVVKIKRLGHQGILEWSGGDPTEAQINHIPQHLSIVQGDTIVTFGTDVFPENYPVGIISDFQRPSGSPFYTITLKLSGQHETLQFAYVINNLFQKEQRALEKLNEEKK